jgi:hypothetical protein
MQKVKIKLGHSLSFWFVGDLRLDETNTEKTINLEALPSEDVETINRSLEERKIKAFNLDGEELKEVYTGIRVSSVDISVEDLPEDELDNFNPEVISVTVPLDDEEEDVEEENTEQFLDEATRIINKNANTVKKIIRNISFDTADTGLLLKAICEAEKGFKNRPGIIKEAEQKLAEFNND